MQWVLLLALVGGLFMISGRHPKVAFSLLGVLVVAAGIIIFATGEQAQKSRQKIAIGELAIERTLVTEAYGGSYKINGRITNNHPNTALKEFSLSVSMLDCKNDAPNDCQIVGQKGQRFNLQVPAGQARDFGANVYFGEVAISGTIGWKFEVTKTRS